MRRRKIFAAALLRICAPWTMQILGIVPALMILTIGKCFYPGHWFLTAIAALLAFGGLIFPFLIPAKNKELIDWLNEEADILDYLAAQDAYPLIMDDVPLKQDKEET